MIVLLKNRNKWTNIANGMKACHKQPMFFWSPNWYILSYSSLDNCDIRISWNTELHKILNWTDIDTHMYQLNGTQFPWNVTGRPFNIQNNSQWFYAVLCTFIVVVYWYIKPMVILCFYVMKWRGFRLPRFTLISSHPSEQLFKLSHY